MPRIGRFQTWNEPNLGRYLQPQWVPVGERFVLASHAGHPYRDWLSTYADPAFAASNRSAVEIAERAASEASASERERMSVAFARSMRHELAFFEAPVAAVSAATWPNEEMCGA